MGGNIKSVVVIDNTTCKVITNTNNSSSSTNKILTINNVARWGHLGGTIYIKYWLKNLVKWQHFLCISHFVDCREYRYRHKRQVSTQCTQFVLSFFSGLNSFFFAVLLSDWSIFVVIIHYWLNFIGLDLFVHCKIYQSCQKLIGVTFLKDQ